MKRAFMWIILIAVIGFALTLMWGESLGFLTKQTTNGITYWKYDYFGYINNIQASVTDTTVLELKSIPRSWANIDANILESEFWEDLGNNLAFMLDIWIFAINLLIYNFRIGGYILRFVLSVIGFNMQPGVSIGAMQWLKEFVQIVINLQIPYV